MEQRDADIKDAIRRMDDDPAQRDRATALINDRIDFREMGRLALGKYYVDLSEPQQDDFVETFSAIVRAQSLSDLTVYNAGVTYDFIGVTGDNAYVRTRARIEGASIKVEYLLRRLGQEWWLYDIILDDVGTIEGYAISFQSYLRKRGFERFMASLHKRRDKIAAEGK